MPWAIRLREEKTSEVCCSYGKHRGTVCGADGNRTHHRLLAKQSRQPWYMLPQIKLNK